jgi:hypothetical protein
VIVTNPDLQFLASVFVFLRPFRIIFSVYSQGRSTKAAAQGFGVLGDFACLDNALDFIDDDGAYAHWDLVREEVLYKPQE